MLKNHREQIVTREPRRDFRGIRRDRHRIRVVHDHRFDLRSEGGIARVQQRIADRVHVDDARQFVRPARHQVRAQQRSLVDRRGFRRREQQPTGPIAPCTRQRRQTCDRPYRVATAADALHAVVQADRCLPGSAVTTRKIDQLRRVDAANLRDTIRRIGHRPFLECVETERMVGDVVVIEQVFGNQHVHHAECERAIGTRFQRNMLMTLLCCQRTVRIDGDKTGASALRFLRTRPEMQTRRDRVRSPYQNQFAFLEMLEMHTETGAICVP